MYTELQVRADMKFLPNEDEWLEPKGLPIIGKITGFYLTLAETIELQIYDNKITFSLFRVRILHVLLDFIKNAETFQKAILCKYYFLKLSQ